MERIVFLERNTFDAEFRRPRFNHEWIEYGETEPEQIVERLRDATIAICNKLPLRESELSRLHKLKLIAVAATGVDNIDLSYCPSRGITVCNTRNYAKHSLPEHVLRLMLALRRNLVAYNQVVREAEWQQAKQSRLMLPGPARKRCRHLRINLSTTLRLSFRARPGILWFRGGCREVPDLRPPFERLGPCGFPDTRSWVSPRLGVRYS